PRPRRRPGIGPGARNLPRAGGGQRRRDPPGERHRAGDDLRRLLSPRTPARRGPMSSEDGGRRILVVGDEPQIVRALKVILRGAGYSTDQAESKEEALNAVSVHPPDAMVLDLVLPDGSGVDVCTEIRTWTSLPIIVLSAVGDEREKVRALD